MIPENLKILVDKLIGKTIAKKAIWSQTSGSNEYKLDLGKGAITVNLWSEDNVGLNIFNEQGEIIESLDVFAREEDFKKIYDLYSEARRSYYKVDETINAINIALDDDKVIGISKPKQDDTAY